MKYCLVNKNYFKIPSPNRDYLLGLIITDGNIYKNYLRYKCTDLEIVNNIKNELESTHKIQNIITSTKPAYSLVVGNKEIINDLKLFDIYPNKTFNTKYPKNIFYHRDFIRGLLDGDGTVYIRRRLKCKDYIGISWCGSYSLISSLEKHLRDNLNLKPKKISKNNTIFRVTYESKKEVIRIFNYIYYDYKCLKLQRKYNRFIDFYNSMKVKVY